MVKYKVKFQSNFERRKKTQTFSPGVVIFQQLLQLQRFFAHFCRKDTVFCRDTGFIVKQFKRLITRLTLREKWFTKMSAFSYHQVHPPTSVFSLQWFEVYPPGLSCTGTPASVAPHDEAEMQKHSRIKQTNYIKEFDFTLLHCFTDRIQQTNMRQDTTNFRVSENKI